MVGRSAPYAMVGGLVHDYSDYSGSKVVVTQIIVYLLVLLLAFEGAK